MNTLTQLAQYTTIVADTGDLEAIARLKPKDATTNPSLITAALTSGKHQVLINSIRHLDIDSAIDHLTIELGRLILTLIDGRVSTEVDARLSFDTQATITKALEFITHYEKLGISSKRVLIKIAATWQGIAAAEYLEKQGIACNLTLLFTDTQAKACADAGVTLISPFVGRITDWQKQQQNKTTIAICDDMGVNSVKAIYHFYKQHGYATEIMGASFRSVEQILALAGCDLLTISPALLDMLATIDIPVTRQLSPTDTILSKPPILNADEFNKAQSSQPLNQLLLAGIDGFVQARQTLASFIEQHR